ncbi:MAG: sensor histidine kinase [Ruminococcus sp.]|nr:sensor histidine kinase [Ruminococcus sp.]
MRYFQDTGFLLLYCLFSVLYTPVDPVFVLAFLCALVLCCVCYFTESLLLHLGTEAVFLSLSLFFPSFFCFFPAAFYIFLKKHHRRILLFAFLLFLYHTSAILYTVSPLPLLYGLSGFLLAFLLRSHTVQYEQLASQFREIQDDSRENHLLLTEKNRVLLEKQDYEIYTATLRERNRIAREIHDNVGHLLSRSILLLGAARTVNQQDSMHPLLEHLDTTLNSAMDSIRNSVHDLHDDSVDLEESIKSLIAEFSFCPVILQYDMGRTVLREVKYCFISVTKEALSNVIRHSNANQVQITMREHPALYQLYIKDNGTLCDAGFDKEQSGHGGIGLSNMSERVHALNGTLQITSEAGFQIFIIIPKEIKE